MIEIRIVDEKKGKVLKKIKEEDLMVKVSCFLCGKKIYEGNVFDFENAKERGEIFDIGFVMNPNLEIILEMLSNPKKYSKEEILSQLDNLTRGMVLATICDTCFYKIFYSNNEYYEKDEEAERGDEQ